MILTPRFLRVTNGALLVLLIVYLATLSFYRPLYNWDMVVYVAASGPVAGVPDLELHQRAT